MPVLLVDSAALDDNTRGRLESAVRDLTTLERVLAWGRKQTLARMVDKILTQDEYTHDVVMAGPGTLFLSLDTT